MYHLYTMAVLYSHLHCRQPFLKILFGNETISVSMSAVALYVYGGPQVLQGWRGYIPQILANLPSFLFFSATLEQFWAIISPHSCHTKDLHSWFIHMCDQRFFKIYPNKDASFWRKDTSNRNLVQFCSQILPLNIILSWSIIKPLSRIEFEVKKWKITFF